MLAVLSSFWNLDFLSCVHALLDLFNKSHATANTHNLAHAQPFRTAPAAALVHADTAVPYRYSGSLPLQQFRILLQRFRTATAVPYRYSGSVPLQRFRIAPAVPYRYSGSVPAVSYTGRSSFLTFKTWKWKWKWTIKKELTDSSF